MPRPGEITLAHHGVLFLDELPEFSRRTLESLRAAARSRLRAISPEACRRICNGFTLVAAMNPCPCGYAGSERCSFAPRDVDKYQQRISGPLLDRIDLQVEMRPLTTEERLLRPKMVSRNVCANRTRSKKQAAEAI